MTANLALNPARNRAPSAAGARHKWSGFKPCLDFERRGHTRPAARKGVYSIMQYPSPFGA